MNLEKITKKTPVQEAWSNGNHGRLLHKRPGFDTSNDQMVFSLSCIRWLVKMEPVTIIVVIEHIHVHTKNNYNPSHPTQKSET